MCFCLFGKEPTIVQGVCSDMCLFDRSRGMAYANRDSRNPHPANGSPAWGSQRATPPHMIHLTSPADNGENSRVKYGHGFTFYYMTCRAFSIAIQWWMTSVLLYGFWKSDKTVEHSIQTWGMRQIVYRYVFVKETTLFRFHHYTLKWLRPPATHQNIRTCRLYVIARLLQYFCTHSSANSEEPLL